MYSRKSAENLTARRNLIIAKSCGPIAQLGERYNGIVEVKGSSPFRSTSRPFRRKGRFIVDAAACVGGIVQHRHRRKETPVAASRTTDQLRPVTLELDYVIYPEGSVLISMGNTRVLCNATVEETLPPLAAISAAPKAWLGDRGIRHAAALHRTAQPARDAAPQRAHPGDPAVGRRAACARRSILTKNWASGRSPSTAT
jgi:hypothetical protein